MPLSSVRRSGDQDSRGRRRNQEDDHGKVHVRNSASILSEGDDFFEHCTDLSCNTFRVWGQLKDIELRKEVNEYTVIKR